MYYYNRLDGISTYHEPDTKIYRPLVRDRRSDALVQAWPSLDETRSERYGPPGQPPTGQDGPGQLDTGQSPPEYSPGKPGVTFQFPTSPGGMISAITDSSGGGGSLGDGSSGASVTGATGIEGQQGDESGGGYQVGEDATIGGAVTLYSTAPPLPTTCVV
jgi:hypothetical protein